MRTVLATVTSLTVITFAIAGCSTLAPDVDVDTGPAYPLTWSDVREIERLLPVLGIRRPIDGISMEGPDRASVRCLVRPLTRERTNEAITFTVVRRNGRWIPVDKPSRGPFYFTA